MFKKGRKKYKVIFSGYSIGGSIAILAALDLIKSEIVNKKTNKPKVFTYGALRIGDAKFVKYVNKYVRVFRIVKENDFVVRTPNCYFSPVTNTWRCFTKALIKKYIVRPVFPIRLYYTRYSKGPLGKLLTHRKVSRSLRKKAVVSYYKYIYYTQPVGMEIFYTSTMNRYQICSYVRGIPSCERKLVIPATFTTVAHKYYYSVNFDSC